MLNSESSTEIAWSQNYLEIHALKLAISGMFTFTVKYMSLCTYK